MTSKLSFRSRALDASKPMPVYRAEEVPDLPDFAAINRGVPPLPSGMEKEEECEHHLQRAMSAQQAFGDDNSNFVIPTPDVTPAPSADYGELYRADYTLPRQLIHMQLFAIEQDYPDYDMDSEDEDWLNKTVKLYPDLTPEKFEQMIDKFEKSSFSNVIQLPEAKALYHEDEPLVDEVYDYWLNKRLRTLAPLLPTVKLEKREGAPSNNPYVAFRRRIEKMQTRKNRKNDESSYERMLKLRRDLNRAVNLLDMVKKREKMKREQLSLTVELFKKRYEMGDFTGQILAEVSAQARPSINNVPPYRDIDVRASKSADDHHGPGRKKREYRKRQQTNRNMTPHHRIRPSVGDMDFGSSDEEVFRDPETVSDQEQDSPDGYFTFRRKKGCYYHAPRTEVGNWPWCAPSDGGLGHDKYRYCLTYLETNSPKLRCIGFARRRVGRGGRIIFDRAHSPDEVMDFGMSADEADAEDENAEVEDCMNDYRS